jgi:hypothetical protein
MLAGLCNHSDHFELTMENMASNMVLCFLPQRLEVYAVSIPCSSLNFVHLN